MAWVGIVLATSSLLEWRRRAKPCAHGVKQHGLTCTICAQEREQQIAAQKKYRAEREQAEMLKTHAQRLRREELQRLSKAWLSDSETYYSMSPQQFEDAIAQLFRKLGYSVKQTPYSNDKGKDAILAKNGETFLVECKRYGELNCIGRPEIQKFVAAMHDEKAVGGFYVNTGRYSPEAKKYAGEHKIVAYDRHTFPSLVLEAYPVLEDATVAKTMCLACGAIVEISVAESPVSALCSNGHTVTNTITPADLRVFSPTGAVPPCEKCGAPMRVVKSYRGRFWGCSEYPKCRFTRKLSSNSSS